MEEIRPLRIERKEPELDKIELTTYNIKCKICGKRIKYTKRAKPRTMFICITCYAEIHGIEEAESCH